ncbi:restriction endonuclease subunit S [Helicobacter suis]|uniref:restriction endonuclease subunit S n=1 Tax=Helicobacter suis TaxID=104628 RepID=UPI0013D0BD17|nr:restriction endonuclease subunit S [Helicobacter suis]
MNSLAQKYPHLEVSVLKLSEVKRNSTTFRLDSEPFKRSNLYIKDNLNYIELSEIAIINPSKVEIAKLPKSMRVTFLSMQNLGSGAINEKQSGTIKDFEKGYTYFAENDILIAKITPCMEHGKCAIAFNLNNKIGFGSTEFNVFRIKDNRFLTAFVFCYLNREDIRKIATKHMVGTSGRQRVPTSFYKTLKIPLLPLSFQEQIETLVKRAHACLEQSKALYKNAQDLLSSQLGLDSKGLINNLSNSNHTIKTLKESFLKTGRLDAEYYQEKYERIEALIKNYPGGWGVIRSYFWHNKESCPLKHSRYFYIEISDIAVGSGAICYHSLDKAELPDNAKILARHGDLLVSKVRPNRGAVAIINHTAPNIIVSGAFVVLREIGGFRKEVLQVLLRLPLYKKYLLKWNVGTSYPVIKDKDILDLPIPKIPQNIQEHIAKYLQKSFVLRQQASKELEKAKVEVERACAGGGEYPS